MTDVSLSIIIVTWNVRDLLRDCLASIYASLNRASSSLSTEVIVVDAASTDHTAQMVAAEFSKVKLIEPGFNVGFSKGNNLAMRASTGEFLFLLNPDTKVADNALEVLVGFLQRNPKVGLAGPQLLNSDGTIQSSRRRFPSIWTGIFESTWLQPLAPRRILSRYYMLERDDSAAQEVDWLFGAALLVRRAVVDQVGMFDEAFFMYSEELDWQRRIKQAGWEIWYVPEAQLVHFGGKSSEQVVAQRHIHFQTSKVRYFRKHHGPFASALIRSVLLGNYVWQLGIEALKGLVGHKRAMREERVRAYWQVIRSGLRES